MSCVAIRNALWNQLTTCGPYLRSEVSACSFRVLEGSETCAIAFFPSDDALEQMTFGQNLATYNMMWGFKGAVYIKFTGDAEAMLGRVAQAKDDLRTTIQKDNSLGGGAQYAEIMRMSFDPERALEAAGAQWAIVEFEIQAQDF